jgi:hypothetical protein
MEILEGPKKMTTMINLAQQCELVKGALLAFMLCSTRTNLCLISSDRQSRN